LQYQMDFSWKQTRLLPTKKELLLGIQHSLFYIDGLYIRNKVGQGKVLRRQFVSSSHLQKSYLYP